VADQQREPTGAAPGVAPTEDRAARRKLLDRYLADRDASPLPGSDVAIPRGPRTTKHPLSLGQEQIWLHSQLISDLSAYNEPLTLTHRGALDVEVLRRTLAEVIRRHEAWRTTFHEVDGQPVAVVHDPSEVDLPVVDLRHLAPPEREREADRLAMEEIRRPFDLETGPLLRFVLFKLDDDMQRFDVAIHQIIFDPVSIYNGFLPELAVIYDDLILGRASSLADPPVQYQDFVRWQRATDPDESLAGQLAYWRDQLGEVQPALGLPTDRPRPSVQSYAGEQVSFSLPEALSRELRAFSQREGVTLFVTLLTAFAVLLARRTGDEIQTIGTVASIRKRPELERLIGFFLNTLALRVDLSGDPTFREALGRARNVVSDGLSHNEVPIHRVVQALSLPRDSSRSPLFQAMLILEPPLPEAPIGWESSTQTVDVGRSRVDLHLQLENRPDALIGRMRYSTALFDRTTVESLVRQWLTLIRAAVAESDRPIGDLPLLTDGERAALLSAGNRVVPTTPFEPFTPDQLEQSIAARFAREVAAFGDRPAVIEADRRWTYRELNAAADGVAGAIVTACDAVRPRVGLLGQPGAPLVAAILGILKAGGAYVPLDPQFPAKRLGSIAVDAELDLIVVGEGLDGLVRDALGDAVPVVDMAAAMAGRAALPIDRAAPGDPAYLLYTSGSTGEPKGTVQSQRNVLHDIRVYTNSLHLGPDDRVLFAAKPTFVTSVKDVFGALLNGAALCVVDLTAAGFLGLRDAIVDRRVTVYHSTPTVYRELIATLGPGQRLTDVRAVVLGGEEARAGDFEAFRRHFARGGVFVNILGSTESSIGLQFFADATSTIDRACVPVGYPVEATDVFLLDPYGRRTDFVGEIAFRSRYVALGYWNRPELTAATFERDPDDPDLVTYRTGDLGRRHADGSLEFVGRRDRQIKVRGMRVEVAEIEQALAALPGVRQVAVEARPIDGETQLVAYLEASGGDRPSQHDLRDALRDQLPEYMVPGAIVWLDRMPRTSSNKIDRRALPAPAAEIRAASVAAPRDDLEERLVGIWEQVLSRHPVGVDDDFFDLGGHSLLAVRLFDRIWRETGQRVPLSALLEGATIERLAAGIRDGQARGRSGLIGVQPGGTRLPLFIVPGAGSRILYLRNLPPHLGPDQPIYALHQPPTGPDGHTKRRVEDLASHYLAELRRVQPVGPYHLVGYSFGGAVAFEIAQQLTEAGETVALLALIDSRAPSQPRPAAGFHPRFIPRRAANQARIVRRLGPRVGAHYLRERTRIAIDHSVVGLWQVLDRRLPKRLRPLLWRDWAPEGEREWIAADGAAFERYHPAPYPGRITFLWAEHNQRPPEVSDTRRGWAELASAGLDVRPIPGSHLTVLVEPLAGITAAVLADALREARAGGEALAMPERRDAPGEAPAPGAWR
jgi:amino acid adenylation domain-containing protein